jgi:hypothetical protein
MGMVIGPKSVQSDSKEGPKREAWENEIQKPNGDL